MGKTHKSSQGISPCHELQLRFLSLHHSVVHPVQRALIWASGADKWSPCHPQLPAAASAGAVSLLNSLSRHSEMAELPAAPLWKPQIKKNYSAKLFFPPLRPVFSLCFYLSFTSATTELPLYCLFPVRDNLHSYGATCFFPFLVYHFSSCMARKRNISMPNI